MEDLLNKLYERLCEAFEEKLKPKEIYHFTDGITIDGFKTLMSLKKTNKDLNQIMLEGSVSIDELKYNFDNSTLNDCFDNKFLIRGNSINSDKVFIGTNGLFKYYSLREFDIHEIFIAFDSYNFKLEKELEIKSQEKIWCIFLLLFGADCKENLFDSAGLSMQKLDSFRKFMISIENEIINNHLSIGKKISWDSGKEKTFRGLIQVNKMLPKTPIYIFSGYKYYLDLSKRKNAKYLLDLILDNYKDENRLLANDLFYDALDELSFNISIELGEMPTAINKYIIEELKG
jgi:hypothetical protein